jgi:effector-binding domain-containing protein
VIFAGFKNTIKYFYFCTQSNKKTNQMKALKIILWIVGILIVLVLIPPLFMSGKMHVQKSLVMAAEPEVIFEQVNCFPNWTPWTPWADAAVNVTYEGPACGQGSIMLWDDGGGKSSQTILESTENELIRTELNFMEQDVVWSDWTFEKTDTGTLVTWKLTGDAPYPIGRWVNVLFVGPEVGKRYVQGLKALNEYTQQMKPQAGYFTGEVATKEIQSQNALAMRINCSLEEIEEKMSGSIGRLFSMADSSGLEMTGPPFTIWYKWEGEEFEFDNCIPVSESINPGEGVRAIQTYSGKVVSVLHTGHYSTAHNSWMVLENWMKENALESNGDPMEVYLTNPQDEPDPTNWVTELVWPVK